jgi:hypothetical protein
VNEPLPDLEELVRWHFAQREGGRCPREVDLARFAAGDLLPEERAEFELHLSGCSECRADLQSFEADLREHPLAPAPRPPAEVHRFAKRARWFAAGAALAAAASVLLLMYLPVPDVLHPKGRQTFQLHVAASRQGSVFRVHEGTRLQPGDQLGFLYSSGGEGQLMVWYASETQTVRIFPAAHPGSELVARGHETPIPDGATFSPSGGCEWIIGMFSPRPITEDEAIGRIRDMVARRHGCALPSPSVRDLTTQVVEVGR